MDANQFRHRMSQLPEPLTDQKPPYWEAWRLDLWRRAQNENPTQFWEWPCIYHTMLVEHWPGPIFQEFQKLDTHSIGRCYVPHCGPDDGIVTDYGYLSKNLIHQAYHIQQWENATGHRISHLDTIVEFGGGYGAMALLCHRLGFEGKYIIYDLPEFSLLQEYYLSQFGILDKVTWNPKRKPKDVDLFMALYSLSELRPGDRIPYDIEAKSYLYLYSGQWEMWNNVEYFQERLPSAYNELTWTHTELTHLPDKNNFYSIGW